MLGQKNKYIYFKILLFNPFHSNIVLFFVILHCLFVYFENYLQTISSVIGCFLVGKPFPPPEGMILCLPANE